jgi:type IV secretory pathway VirB2 component (pilin)
MTYDFSSVLSFLSSTFRIPTEWLGFPAFLTNLIIPFILMAYAFYNFFLRIRIFGYHTGIYVVLSSIFALVLLPVGPLFAIIAAGFIAMFGMTSWKSRIIFFVILAAVYLFIIPFLASLPTIRF